MRLYLSQLEASGERWSFSEKDFLVGVLVDPWGLQWPVNRQTKMASEPAAAWWDGGRSNGPSTRGREVAS